MAIAFGNVTIASLGINPNAVAALPDWNAHPLVISYRAMMPSFFAQLGHADDGDNPLVALLNFELKSKPSQCLPRSDHAPCPPKPIAAGYLARTPSSMALLGHDEDDSGPMVTTAIGHNTTIASARTNNHIALLGHQEILVSTPTCDHVHCSNAIHH